MGSVAGSGTDGAPAASGGRSGPNPVPGSSTTAATRLTLAGPVRAGPSATSVVETLNADPELLASGDPAGTTAWPSAVAIESHRHARYSHVRGTRATQFSCLSPGDWPERLEPNMKWLPHSKAGPWRGRRGPATGLGMSLESVRAWLASHAPDLPIIEVAESTATVAEAARALGVEPGRIAKTLAVRVDGNAFLLVARGDARLDNQKTKAAFGGRPRMLGPEETLALTGHPVGGVCPFGLATDLPVWCDVSLQGYPTVFPAAGSLNSSVEVAPDRLAALVGKDWVDMCRLAE